MDLYSIKQEIVEYGIKLKHSGLVAGTWGNVSARTDKYLLVTPSGVDYDHLKPEDIVVCDFKGKVIEGNRIPSSELVTHISIYKARSDVKSIIHTHSIFASAFAVARKNIPATVEDMAMIIGGDVPCAQYAFPGSDELSENILKVLRNKNAVLLANHGVVGMGRNLKEAFLVCQILEKSAQIHMCAMQIGTPQPLSIDDSHKLREIYLNKYSKLDK